MFRRSLSTFILTAVGAAIASGRAASVERPAVRTVLAAIPIAASGSTQAPRVEADGDVIAIERTALDRWIKGDPGGFLDIYANDVTYFDPSQERRIDGLQAMTAYLTPIRGKITIDRYELLNPKVQRHGDVAVLSYHVVNYRKQPDGTERSTTRWNSTAVFQRIGGRWRTIHSHFSYTKPELKSPDR